MATWLMVTSEDSFRATSEKGLLGFYGDARGQQLINKTAIGDRIVFYITKKKEARGLFLVESSPFLDESSLYGDHRDNEWNQRIKVKALDSQASCDFDDLRWDLDLIKDKALPYTAYLVNTLVPLSEKDFNTVLAALGIKERAIALS